MSLGYRGLSPIGYGPHYIQLINQCVHFMINRLTSNRHVGLMIVQGGTQQSDRRPAFPT